MTGVVRAYAPGRTELAGNHTDHQGGRVIAATVSCGVQLELRPNDSSCARVESAGFDPFQIDVADASARADERGTTAALVRGVVAGVRALGVPVGGFDARVSSTVPPGGGLSSSAAFELALATALCARAGEDAGADATPVQLAKIGQAAERDWFGKACGLMDQLAIAVGGIAAIDFSGEEPQVSRLDFDFEASGYAVCLIDTHCDHSRYTDEYSQVPRDMSAVAALLGADVLSHVPEQEFLARFQEVRQVLGDAPALRALHYYHESRLVDERIRALQQGDIESFLHFTRLSGASSAQYLQNVSTFDRASQPAMAVLALADLLLQGRGACRIHGGGFGGTVQAFVPRDDLDQFATRMDDHLGAGSCRAYSAGVENAHCRTE